MRWPIRTQLLVPLLTLLLGVVGVTTWTGIASANRARHQIETQMRASARTLSDAYFPLTEPILRMTKDLSGADYLLDDGSDHPPSTLAARAIELPAAETVHDEPDSLRLGPRVVVDNRTYFCSGVRVRRGPNAGASLYILYPETLWRDALWEAIRPSLVLGGFVGLASVALALGVGQRLGGRIQELERRTRLIAAGDFSPMPLPDRDDELRDLTRSVNEMAQRLAQFQETVQKSERLRLLGQVSAGLAHQLRNAATGARLAVQLHARTCAGSADAEALDVALRQLALLEANLKRFLDLGSDREPRPEPCSLSALVDEAVALLRPQCRHAHIDLRWQPPEKEVLLLADAGQLGHVLLNVIGNAVEAAGPGGWVCVEVLAGPQAALLAVTDSGPGPSPQVAERLFEPFVTGKRDGVGLGLAVARQVVEAHGGRMSWRREPDRTRFAIELPVAPETMLTGARGESNSDRR